MRIYKFLNKTYALKSIRERNLKIARLSGLNDPFEMFPFDNTGRAERLALQTTLSEINEEHGLLCFSRTWSNPLMWAHYADQHRGLCLGFEILNDKFPQEIVYTKSREPFPADLVSRDESEILKAMKHLLFTKFEDWRHEDEVRLSINLDKDRETAEGLYFMDWGDQLKLVEIVVGLRSPTCRRELESALIGYPEPVTFIRARASWDAFAVVPDGDAIRNHDDLTYYLRRNDTIHPVEFVR